MFNKLFKFLLSNSLSIGVILLLISILMSTILSEKISFCSVNCKRTLFFVGLILTIIGLKKSKSI